MSEQRLIDANNLKTYCYEVLLDTDNPNRVDGLSPCNGLTEDDIDLVPTVLTIPDNPTNGDMLKILFPSIALYEKNHNAIEISFKGDWWNSPYKAQESEDDKDNG
jgi:hypothetical protein